MPRGLRIGQAGTPAEFFEIPADRITVWQPGVTYNGGIPSGRPVFTTIAATGDTTDRRATIQAAIDACPAGHDVVLEAAEYYLENPVIINKDDVVLRGTHVSSAVRTALVKPAAHRPTNVNNPPFYAQGSNPHAAVIISRASSLNLDGATTPFAAIANLTADGAKGAYTVTVASTTGFAVGDLVRLDELSGASWQTDPRGGGNIWASPDFRTTYQCSDPPDGLQDFTGGVLPPWFDAYTVFDRPICEMKKIAAISGNQVTFTTPLHIDYRTSLVARIAKYNGDVVRNSGVENITAYGFNLGTFLFWLADKCWARGCEADYWFDKPFRFGAAFQCEVRRSLHRGTPWPSNSAENYGFIFDWASSDCLVEDSIGFACNKVFAARAAGAGCVVAYCYLDAGMIGYQSDPPGADTWVEVGANASHFNGPHHVLFEGNLSFNADSDFTHGNSTYITHFRNWYTGFREEYFSPITGGTYNDKTGVNSGGTSAPGPNGPKRCAATQTFGYGHSFVCNVLGTPGLMSGWKLEGNDLFDAGNSIYLLGWAPTSARPQKDPQVANPAFWGAMLRDGNYDYLTNSILWHGLGGVASASHTTPPAVSAMPDSLYAPSKPAFFGANQWPWVTPEGATKTYTLPAKARFESGDFFT